MSTHNQKGAVAPLVAIMLVLIVVCVALVVDLGHIHNVKVELQRAVDAAALAGAGQLGGSIGAGQAAIDVAVATAAANRVDQDPVSIDPAAIANPNFNGFAIKMVQPINWNKNIIDPVSGTTLSTAARITPLTNTAEYDTANGLWVTAKMDVEHIFFFFTDNTPVTADAIAVNIFEEPTIPIALVSCIPTGGKSINISSPGLSICDITTYEFHADTDDSAAWTSLTFNPASQTNINKFLDVDGPKLFNQVVYGDNGTAQQGIENTTVSTANRILPDVPDFPAYSDVTRGCVDNDGLTINCGLGADLSLDPTDPELIRQADPSKVPAAALTDPLAYNPLPRWYHFDDDDTTTNVYTDAFTRLLTQNGTLVQGDDSITDYQIRLQRLYAGDDDSPYGGAGDYRFKASGTKEKFITKTNVSGTDVYKPNFNEVLRYAGYPPVWVNNGTIPPALTQFLDGLVNPAGKGKDSIEFKTEVSNDFEPFDAGNAGSSGGSGESVRLTMPVIFAGACDDWKALSVGPVKSDIKLYYVGTANFLLTRAWKSSDCFDEGTRAITIDPIFSCPNPPPAAKIFDPTISGNNIRCGSGKTPNAAIEGMMRVPTKGDITEAGIRKIYLVE